MQLLFPIGMMFANDIYIPDKMKIACNQMPTMKDQGLPVFGTICS